MSDLASTIKINADASGVEAGVNSAKRSISSLGQAASQAGKSGAEGMDRLGASGDAAAKKIEASTRNTIASIQRQTAALEAGGASSRAYQESLAKMRGIDVGALKPYLDQLDAAKAKANAATTANASLGNSFGLLKTAVVAFAGVASVNAFKDMVQGSIQAAAGLHDMSIQTGASVAALMAFRSVAATTNTSIEGVASAMNRAAKGMAVANEDSKGIGQAVKSLGLDFDALRKMKPEDQMLAVAKAMDGFQDGAGKAAAAMALYGKEGAKMLPFLKDLADESESVTKKMTEQQVAAKKAQAAMADDYTDNLVKIKKASDAWKKDVSMAMLPALSNLAQAFLDVNKSTGGIKQGISDLAADGSITEWTRIAVTGISYVVDAFQVLGRVAKTVMLGIGTTLALTAENMSMIWNVTKGLFGKEPVINIINASMERQKIIAKSVADEFEKTWGNETFGQKLRARIEELKGMGLAAKAAKPELDIKDPALSKNGSGEKISDYQKLIRVIAEKQAQDEAQLSVGHDLSESEKIRAKLLADITTGTVKLTAVEKYAVEARLAQLGVTERQLETNKAFAAQYKANSDAAAAQIKSATAEADRNEELARTFGMSKSAIEALTIARLEEQLIQQKGFAQTSDEIVRLEALIAAKKRSAAAIGSLEAQQASADVAKKAAEEWKKTAESINNSITDALMRGFESGKGFAENLKDTVVNMFKTLVLRPVISAVVNPVAQGITGMMGFSGAANAAGTASGLGGFGSAIGAAGAFQGIELSASAFSTLSSVTTALQAIPVWGWAAAGALALIGTADHGNPTANTGNASARYDALGNRTDYQTYYGGSSAGVDKMLASLQDSYTKAAQALGIGAAATQFSYGGNTGKNGESPNFALGGGAGSSRFYQGETASSDAAISLAASRAVFAALQGSDLPAYLSKVFDGLSAGALSQDQITGTLAYAQSLKQVRDALLETREPLQILQDNVAAGVAALGTSADTFKRDFVAAIDSGITPDKLAQWQGLQGAMDQLAQASGQATEAVTAVSRSIADIANERTRLQDQLDELTMTSTQLLEKQRNAVDGSNRALFDQVQAAQAAKDAVDALSQAMTDLASANSALESARVNVANAYKAIQDAAASAARSVGVAQDNITNGYLAAQARVNELLGQSTAALSNFSDNLGQFLRKLTTTDLGSNSKAQQLAAMQADFAISAAQARAGDTGALGSITGKAEALLTAGKAQSATALDFARLVASVSNTLTGIAGPGSNNPAVKAQQDLASAQADLTKWTNAAAVSGASTARATTDYLVEWRTATAANVSAQAELLAAQNATQGIDLSLTDAIGNLQTAIAGFGLSLSAQLHALSTALAAMRVNGTGGTVAGAGTYTGTQAAQSIADAYAAGSTTAQIIASASSGFGVTSAELATVADAAGYTEISDYQKRIDATAELSQDQIASVVAQAVQRAQASGSSPEAEFVKYLLSIGWNAGMGDKAMGWPNGTTNAWATANGFPAFAVGTNYVPRDMVAQIHEGEAIVPKAYNPAAGATRDMARLEALVERLTAEVEGLRFEARATATATNKTAKLLDRVTPAGDALATRAAA